MVKTPRARHSNNKKEPVTIELGPDQVSRLTGTPETAEEATAATGSVTPENEAATTANAGSPDEAATAEENIEPDDAPDRTDSSASYYGTDSASSSTAEAEAMPVPPSTSSGGLGRPVAAGIAGGVIALLLAGGLQWAGLIPALGHGGSDAALRSLRADVDALEQKMVSSDAGTVDAETIRQALAPADKRIGELAGEIEQMKKDVAAAGSAASGGSADTAALTEMRSRLTKLEQGMAAASKAAPSARTVDALGQKVASLVQTAAANSEALKKLQDSVGALGGKVAEQANEPQATAAIAASALKSAIDRGGSFAAELDMFAAVSPDTPELGELRALAARGVPTRARLAAEVGPVADGMQDAARPAPTGNGGVGGVVDRLLASARSLVRVRPVGNVGGDGVSARIARFRNAVVDGDLAKAADEYDALPDKAKAAGADFMAGLQARLKVDALAQKALASVLKTG